MTRYLIIVSTKHCVEQLILLVDIEYSQIFMCFLQISDEAELRCKSFLEEARLQNSDQYGWQNQILFPVGKLNSFY
jgi:hypothetical protein